MKNVKRDPAGVVIGQTYDRAGVSSPDPGTDGGGVFDRRRMPSDWGLGYEYMLDPFKAMNENPIQWPVDQSVGVKKP